MFLAAGVASAHVAGSDWDALLKKRLVDPLGMKRSNSRVSEMLKDKNASKGYLWDEDKERALQDEISVEVNEAIRDAEKAGPPPAESLITDVYEEVPATLRAHFEQTR